MRKCCGASTRIAFGGGNIICEDAETLDLAPDLTKIKEAMIPYKGELDDFNAVEWAKENLGRPPAAYATMMKVTLATVDTIGMVDKDGKETLNAQRGESEYAVAALLIWMQCKEAKWLISKIGVNTVPLREWDTVKETMQEARRIGRIVKGEKNQFHNIAKLRRLHTLMGRTQEQADWEKEFAERNELPEAKFAAGKMGLISQRGFRHLREKVLTEISSSVVREIKHKCGSFEEFFEKRWWHMPSGTTSEGKMVKEKCKGQDFFDNKMVASKKTRWEMSSLEEALNKIEEGCCIHARGSTKPEPGKKKRALLAIDDTSHLVASYASQFMERNTNVSGVVVSQMPQDVARWVSLDCGERALMVSNDYDNYNIQHSLESLYEINVILAKEWRKVYNEGESWALDKLMAAMWTALSYRKAKMKVGDREMKVKRGLFSGHRDTARDNTYLHLVYYRAIRSIISAMFNEGFHEGGYYMSGDDEVSRMSEPWSAILYTIVSDEAGYKSQVAKGLLSWRHSEFLQLWSMPGNPPIYPIAHTILTFCSGNWYKDNIRDLSGTISSCRDHCYEMYRSGLPIEYARGLAIKTLNFLMRIKDSEGKLVDLEWFRYRNTGCKRNHPLWNIGNEREADIVDPKTFKFESRGIQEMENKATMDGMKVEGKFWELVGEGMRRRVERERTWKNYSSITTTLQQKEVDKWAQNEWERRVERKFTYEWLSTEPKLHEQTSFRYRNSSIERSQEEKFAVCSSIGFPAELLGTRWESVAAGILEPRQATRLLLCKEQEKKEPLGDMWLLPVMLRPAAIG
jgi:hypothetical protein